MSAYGAAAAKSRDSPRLVAHNPVDRVWVPNGSNMSVVVSSLLASSATRSAPVAIPGNASGREIRRNRFTGRIPSDEATSS